MAQTTLERHQAGRDAVSAEVGDLMNQIADRISLGLSDGFFPDGLTQNLARAYQAALAAGPELAPRPSDLAPVMLLDPALIPASDPS